MALFRHFNALGLEIQTHIISHLDPPTAAALSQTNSTFYHICDAVLDQSVGHVVAPASLPSHEPVTGVLAAFTLASSTSGSPSSSGSDDDTSASTDTDITTPDEDEWVFKITPDLVRRLSFLPQANRGPTLHSLPNELKLEVFSYLDKIDSTCLGLASPAMYPIFRAIHGVKIPLNTRRIGPNTLESAWEVVDKQQCKQCGIYRCELHMHIKSWMPKELEYCSFKQNFGLPAGEGANESCYRGKPSKPKRCGRHPLRTTSVHQDDALALSTM